MRAAVAGIATGFILSFLTASLAWAASTGSAATGKLLPKDIQATFFNGQAFTASTPSNIKFKMTFTSDGKMKREPAGGTGARGEGTWKLSKEGFCTAWKGAKDTCFTVAAAGANKWSVLKGSTVMATWSK